MEWFTAKELAGMPGMPGTEQGVTKRAKAKSWPFRPRQGRGGGREYPLSCLPAETQRHIISHADPDALKTLMSSDIFRQLDVELRELVVKRAIPAAEPQPPAIRDATDLVASRDLDSLRFWQRDIMHYRCCILNVIDKMALALGTRHKGVDAFLRMLDAPDCPPQYIMYVEQANARKGGGRRLSAGTIYRWFELRLKGGDIALAPSNVDKFRFPAWAGEFLRHYQMPTRPSIQAALELMPPDIRPDYQAAYRFVRKCSVIDINRIRMSRKELSGLKGFVRRDTSGLSPLDVVVIDGHTMKAYVAHPVHGKPFHPEICVAIDAATRVVVGWSIGLAESATTVGDCIRHCITVSEAKPFGGIPAILYSDNGAGLLAGANSTEMTGLYDRLGITHKTGIPGNSQARGLVESLNKNLWVRGARLLETFTGSNMNDDHRRKTYLRLKKEARGGGPVAGLMPWDKFMSFLCHLVDTYHNRPHSALPKIRDKETFRLVHMTPAQMWGRFAADGWQPELPEQREIEAIKRPWKQVRTARGEVRLLGNIYYAGELAHLTGSDVIVEYDIHDAMRVWVRDIESGEMICEAIWNANKVAYFPKSAQDDATDKRRERRLRLKLEQVAEIQAEAGGIGVIDIQPEQPAVEIRRRLREELELEMAEMAKKQAERPKREAVILDMPEPEAFTVPEKPREKWRFWKGLDAKIRAGEPVSDKERQFWRGFQSTADYRSFVAMDEEFGDWAAVN